MANSGAAKRRATAERKRQDWFDLIGFARLLASYGCADDCDLAERKADELCGPCSARVWLEARGLQRSPNRVAGASG